MSWSRRRVSKLINRMFRGHSTEESKDNLHQNDLEQSDRSAPDITVTSLDDITHSPPILMGNFLKPIQPLL